ncbi:variable large family protein [Borrelia persica]|uniref:variable large family protein n=1 Tax=Borrelia persica TaxID=44448 RepID=UPI0004BC8544
MRGIREIRRGEEMRGGIGKMNNIFKRSLIIIMILGMMGCGQNVVSELEQKNEFLSSIANLGKGFLDVFVTFGDMVSGTLGIKVDTKKSEIGKYFSDIAETMGKVKIKLNTIVAEHGNYEKVKEVVEKFISDTLDKTCRRSKRSS